MLYFKGRIGGEKMVKRRKRKSTSAGRRYNMKRTPHHWVTRNADGTFRKWTNKSRSNKADRRKKAKTTVKPGYGHRGDQKRK